MAVKLFDGKLNQNAVLGTLYNMIISQEVFADNINLKGTLAERFRTDGTLYGDTKLFISTDIGYVYNFGGSGKTLLSKTHPKEPKTQAITIDTFKQTAITIDSVKLKQAFMSSDIYGAFISVVTSWLRNSMAILNTTLINAYIGTTMTTADRAEIKVELPDVSSITDISEKRQAESYVAELIGASIANVMVELKDVLREFNDYNFLRTYQPEDFILVWNKRWINRIKHISLPKIFHDYDVLKDHMLESDILNDRYFGTVVSTAGTSDGATYRTLVDFYVTDNNGVQQQYFPGDIIPNGWGYKRGEAYTVDDTIICKLVHKNSVKFMSALVIETEFYNPMDLDRNHYLTWGYSKPQYLAEYPLLTFTADIVESEELENPGE